jgi:protein phosphatase
MYARWLATGKQSKTPYPYKHVITRAIGSKTKANPEIAISSLQEGDLFFLCSDGITDVLPLEEMEEILNAAPFLEQAVSTLIERAKNKGGSDNMTVLMVTHE